MPSPLRRRLAAILLMLATLGLATAAGCGGGGGNEDAQDLLDKAFNHSFDSANVRVDLQLNLEGVPALAKGLRIQANGPYRQNKGKLPSFDLDLDIRAGGGGQSVRTGRLSTGDRLFVKFQDQYYEVPQESVEQSNKQVERDTKNRKTLQGIGPDARKWLKDARMEGDAEVAGTDSRHVAGKLDIGATLRGLNGFASRATRALGPGAAPTTRPLPKQVLKQAEDIVKDPTFDVYVGKDDDVIRRVSATLDFEVPEKDRASVNGLTKGSVELNVEFSDINGNQKIEAPSNARPLSDLTKSLGATGALGGLGGLPNGGSQQPAQPPPATGGDRNGGGQPGPEAFKRYADCLDKADAADRDALQACEKFLR